MGFVKVQKNKAYYKRLQTKYRRRREGKTDYFARRKMITQDKNKYNSPKYRMVVRLTKKKFIVQIVWSTILGDKVLSQATSTELEKFGIPCGYTNYAAGYATGLLIARRALTLMGLEKTFTGVEEVTAEEFHVEKETGRDHGGDKNPFKVVLDCGLIRTIPGSRVFSVLKGAVDGGLHVPHSVKNFPGYKEPEEKGMDYEYDASAHLERITGVHVQEYMEMLQEEDPERYKVAFSKFIAEDIEPDAVVGIYEDAFAKIREDPVFVKKEKSGCTNTRKGDVVVVKDGDKETTYHRYIRRSKAQRVDRVKQKMETAKQKILAAMEGAEEEEEE